MKRFIVTAALGAGLLATPLFTSGAGAARPDGITFQKTTSDPACGAEFFNIPGEGERLGWGSEENPSDANRFLRENDCGHLSASVHGAVRLP